MFTGLIESTGILIKKKPFSGNILLSIEPLRKDILKGLRKGASISVNGVCLSVAGPGRKAFDAFLSTETCRVTNLKEAGPGDVLNLERALVLGSRLDGHLVQGHTDGTALVTRICRVKQDFMMTLRIPADLLKYTILRGSIAVNGISLTISRKQSDLLSFALIPETWRNTNIPCLKPGQRVNIEVDMVAKYLRQFTRPG